MAAKVIFYKDSALFSGTFKISGTGFYSCTALLPNSKISLSVIFVSLIII
jgi:hypothetical protein